MSLSGKPPHASPCLPPHSVYRSLKNVHLARGTDLSPSSVGAHPTESSEPHA